MERYRFGERRPKAARSSQWHERLHYANLIAESQSWGWESPGKPTNLAWELDQATNGMLALPSPLFAHVRFAVFACSGALPVDAVGTTSAAGLAAFPDVGTCAVHDCHRLTEAVAAFVPHCVRECLGLEGGELARLCPLHRLPVCSGVRHAGEPDSCVLIPPGMERVITREPSSLELRNAGGTIPHECGTCRHAPRHVEQRDARAAKVCAGAKCDSR